ncbi:hypothetical protein [Microbulbifer agarilyticus]|uniref:hypothetical protein n=1 Tax=Microbulbifer agarilyticus TaxID=260552 RepID=UPI001CD7D754|nr:hypothetical protein [Microbulbifer agarilyticus]MCA0901138.1 hypothetical protein [Microbulbifer agarilyticus]
MTHKLLLTALATTLAASVILHGCSRKSDTNDPDTAPTTEAEVVEEVTVTEPDPSTQTTTSDSASPAASTGDTSSTESPESPNSEGQLICNAKWFEWVNGEVMKTQGLAIAEHYPTGLPEVGSEEWFTAMDKLTGGDGAHGPDGGSDEWCFMMQQRLSKND